MLFLTPTATVAVVAILGVGAVQPTLPALTAQQTEQMGTAPAALARYPTEAEIADLRQELEQKIPQLLESGFYTDLRPPEEQQQRAEFVAAWMAVDSAMAQGRSETIAPFLGEWGAIAESLAIFPTGNPGQVCIIESYLGGSDFYLGQVINGQIYTDIHQVLVLEGDFLASFFVYEDEANLYAYSHPWTLVHPTASSRLTEQYPEVITQFQAAGCLTQGPD
ncbi:hypothetical protein [Leptolyngbya sp. PCC 6406]|uniref:hypothetical protein n=1 Tax=Leptolyngbya sp. PCC 6406 TaxID=1173264 RepID=UPI0002AC92B1|nr:hypothetical protein [Leptolyngbya sp. PCC 6406]